MYLCWTLCSSVNSFVTKWDDGFMKNRLQKNQIPHPYKDVFTVCHIEPKLHCVVFCFRWTWTPYIWLVLQIRTRLPVNAPHQIDIRFLLVAYLLYSAISSWGIRVIFLPSPYKKILLHLLVCRRLSSLLWRHIHMRSILMLFTPLQEVVYKFTELNWKASWKTVTYPHPQSLKVWTLLWRIILFLLYVFLFKY